MFDLRPVSQKKIILTQVINYFLNIGGVGNGRVKGKSSAYYQTMICPMSDHSCKHVESYNKLHQVFQLFPMIVTDYENLPAFANTALT